MTLRAIAALLVIAAFARAAPRVDALPVEQYRLGNGLVVMLAPDASASSVAVHVRFDAPSDGDIARRVELQLPSASVHVPDWQQRIADAGGWSTSASTPDSFSTTEQVPAHALALALWFEAERMAGFAEAIIGDEEARRYAREHIAPNRATLVVAGRFDGSRTRQLVERYFGWIPAREGRTQRRNVTEPRFEPALALVGQVLAARLPGDVRVEIVRDRGKLRASATPIDGTTPAQVTPALERELTAMRARPPADDEIARARVRAVTDFYVTVEHLFARAEMLASWAASGRGGALVQRWPELLAQTTSEDITAAIAQVQP